eukprot:15178518-Alexandrium_andersonii.AAC.1
MSASSAKRKRARDEASLLAEFQFGPGDEEHFRTCTESVGKRGCPRCNFICNAKRWQTLLPVHPSLPHM